MLQVIVAKQLNKGNGKRKIVIIYKKRTILFYIDKSLPDWADKDPSLYILVLKIRILSQKCLFEDFKSVQLSFS